MLSQKKVLSSTSHLAHDMTVAHSRRKAVPLSLQEQYKNYILYITRRRKSKSVAGKVASEERVCSLSALRAAPTHVLEARLASGRGVAIWLHGDKLFCLDAACYHHGGPLAAGDIEDVAGGGTCVLCPWHRYKILLSSGECLYSAIDASGAVTLRSKGIKQRTHAVRAQGDDVFVQESAPPPLLVTDAASATTSTAACAVASDAYAMQAFLPAAGVPFAGGMRIHSNLLMPP